MRRILVTGRGGQLATGLETAFPALGFEALLVGQPEFEFDKPETVVAAFQALKPDAVVNCAAWTAVDAAEDQEEAAFRANALGPALLGQLSRDAGIPIIQISTDYVFDGNSDVPYATDAIPNPQGAYGRAKLLGEKLVQDSGSNYTIFRTAWLMAHTEDAFQRLCTRRLCMVIH